MTKDKIITTGSAKEDWAHQECQRLETVSQQVLERAKALGASSAEIAASVHGGLSVTVRKGEVETIEYSRDRGLGITVYFGDRKANASTADLSEESIRASIETACAMAKHTEPDPCAGLADAELMATDFSADLDLWHPWNLDAEQATEIAQEMENAGFEHDSQISNSEGAAVSAGSSISVYANSHGFVGHRVASRHSLSCSLLAQKEDSMQRDYAYDIARCADDLKSPKAIGAEAAQGAVRRLGSGPISTRQCPILFRADVARTLFGHLISAVSGNSLYRGASFLLNKLDQPVFNDKVTLQEQPFEPRGLRSVHFDSEGVAVSPRVLIDEGVLRGYILGSYSARKLNMTTTGNAGGVHNLTLTPGTDDLEQLIAAMGHGLLVTDLMGQGVNIVNGDYSRGCSGFWVENGKIAQPVEGVTIAGNLKDMFNGIAAIGCDTDRRSSIRSASVLINQMTLAGQ